jgi:hypothetical protein
MLKIVLNFIPSTSSVNHECAMNDDWKTKDEMLNYIS